LIVDRNETARIATVKLSTINYQLAVLVGGCVVAASVAQAQGNSSLTESKIESAETKVTAEALVAQNEALRRQLSIQQESIKTLTASLAESNAEAEVFRRKFADLESRMETLGLASASKDRAKLEQRLLGAVSDLRLARKERDELRDQLLALNESLLRYLQTVQGGDAQARADVEAQLRKTNELVGRSKTAGAKESQASLMDASVLSVKDEWSFVVANIGEQHGVKIGMPLRAMRGEQKIATLRVVDVRQRICGAVIEDSGKEKIKVGDRLQVDASKVSLK
jgi:septal ring factor EnvC (AmiA/AmiB activator)